MQLLSNLSSVGKSSPRNCASATIFSALRADLKQYKNVNAVRKKNKNILSNSHKPPTALLIHFRPRRHSINSHEKVTLRFNDTE
jgi:hypothetical protein